jgi:hypothetical protein
MAAKYEKKLQIDDVHTATLECYRFESFKVRLIRVEAPMCAGVPIVHSNRAYTRSVSAGAVLEARLVRLVDVRAQPCCHGYAGAHSVRVQHTHAPHIPVMNTTNKKCVTCACSLRPG